MSLGTCQTAWPPLSEAAPSEESDFDFSLLPLFSRWRYVDELRHATSPETDASASISNCVPRSWGERLEAHTRTSNGSAADMGCTTSIRFAMCTSPITGNGNDVSVISPIASGKATMCG